MPNSSQSSAAAGAGITRRDMVKAMGATGIVGSTAGCFGGDDEQEAVDDDDLEDVEITFWEYFGGTEQDEITALVDEFNEQHDEITVEMSNVAFDEFFESVFTAVASQDAPHVTTYWMSFSEFMRNEGAIDPITDIMENDIEDYYESAHPAMQRDGEVYAIPMDVHGYGLWVNNTVLDDAGVDEIPDDWDSFEEACNQIQQNTEARPAAIMENNDGVSGMRTYFSVLQQEDDPNLVEETDDGWEVVYDQTEGGQNAAQFLHDFTGEYEWDQPELADDEERINAFIDDELGFFLGGNWLVNLMQDEDGELIEGLDMTFTEPFVFPGGNNGTFAESTGFFFPADSSHTPEERTAAVRFAEWITTNNPLWAQTAGHLPAATEVGTSDEVTESAYYQDYGIVSTLDEMAANGDMIYQPSLPADLYETGISSPIVDIYGQNAEPMDALESSAETLRDRLS